MCAYIIHTIKSSLSQLYVCWKHNVSMKNDDDNDYGKDVQHAQFAAQTMSCAAHLRDEILRGPLHNNSRNRTEYNRDKDDTSNFY
jgi:hypothetical protein